MTNSNSIKTYEYKGMRKLAISYTLLSKNGGKSVMLWPRYTSNSHDVPLLLHHSISRGFNKNTQKKIMQLNNTGVENGEIAGCQSGRQL